MNNESTYEHGARKWIITITVILCAILELIDTSIVNVALTQLMGNLGATLSEVSWVVAAYGIANVIVVPMSGWLSAQFGRKQYFVGSVILFTVTSFLCGQATGIWELVLFRFIQGIGGGALLATSQTILTETFPPEQRGLSSALFGMGVIVGPTLGPVLGGYIVDNYSWQWIFYVNLPVGLIATFFATTYLRPSKITKTPLASVDWLGMFLLIAGIGSLQLVLEQGDREDWFESAYITAFAVLAVVGVVAFIWRELTAERPIVNLRVLKSPTLALGVTFSFILGFGLFSSVFILPVFVQRFLGFTAQQAGLMMMPGAIVSGLMMPVVGGLLQKGVPQKYMIALGFTIFFAFTFLMSARISPVSGEGDFFFPQILRGIGMGLLFVPVTTLSLSGLKGAEIAQGAGLTNMIRQLGGSFGVAIMSTYIEHTSQLHRGTLLAHLSEYNPDLQTRLLQYTQGFMARGVPYLEAKMKALGALEFTLYKQMMIQTYMDTFMILGIFFLLCVPFALLIRVRKQQGKIDMSAAH